MIRAGHMLSWPAERYPDRIAVTYEGQHMTFREVNARVNRLAHGLMALGLQRGDRVAALLYNSPRAIEVRFALMKAGLCMVALNVRQSEAEHAYIINHSESRVLILDADYVSIWERIRTTCAGVQQVLVATPEPTRYLAYDDLIAGSPAHEPEVMVSPRGERMSSNSRGNGPPGQCANAHVFIRISRFIRLGWRMAKPKPTGPPQSWTARVISRSCNRKMSVSRWSM